MLLPISEMIDLNQQRTVTQSVNRRRKSHFRGFWVLLGGGSLVAHLSLIYLVEGLSAPTVNRPGALGIPEAVVPIDFMELPADSSVVSLPPESRFPSDNQTDIGTRKLEATATPAATNDPTAIGIAEPLTAKRPEGDSPETHDSHTHSPVAGSRTEAKKAANLQVVSPASTPASTPPSARPTSVPPRPAVSPTPNPVDAPPPQPLQVAVRPLAPSPSPSPLITAEPIDVPIPDVSGVLPLPIDPEIAAASARVVEQITVPSQLTASLTTANPGVGEGEEPDETAYPKTETQTFSSNPDSPCVMQPEAVPFLGKTVAMQVMTDELGQVVDTVTQESSQSQAYDELAICLVKNWGFEPALAKGQPIATDGLVVRITIDAEG